MTEQLLMAIQKGRRWSDRFNSKDYDAAYREYVALYGPLYDLAVEQTGAEGLPALADSILEGLAAGWKKALPWNRSVTRYTDRQMLIFYLSPMLLGRKDPNCALLARLLQERWAERLPASAYDIADYRTITRGFRNVILGVDLGALRKKDPEEEE